MVLSLKEQLIKEFSNLEVSKEEREKVVKYLAPLESFDFDTWAHSIRVALILEKVAKRKKIVDPKLFFLSGLLHDVGKIKVSKRIVKKKKKYNWWDYYWMRKHVIYGYKMVKEDFPFVSAILVYMHYYRDGYPKKIPKFELSFDNATLGDIQYYARLLSIIDFYDAAVTRVK